MTDCLPSLTVLAEVTVSFYRRLPSYGYKLIIFRAHSGLLHLKGELVDKTWLFTNENYSQTKYRADQLSDRVVKARIGENHPWLFAIGSEFVTHGMEEQFDNAVIIMMGCAGLYIDDLAQAFIEKGVSSYVGWDNYVGLDYAEEATINLIYNLSIQHMTIRHAVDKTMAQIGPGPLHGASLKYYPAKSANKTLRQLTE